MTTDAKQFKTELDNSEIRRSDTLSTARAPQKIAASHFSAMSTRVDDANAVTSKVLVEIDGHHVEVSRSLADYYARKRSLLVRLFPTKLDKVLQDSQLGQAKTDADLNERMLKLACDLKLAACIETGDAWLKSLKIGVRQRFNDFVTERYASLQATVERRRVEFGEHVRGRYRTLESYRDMPALAAQYEESIGREVESYCIWLDQLLENFRSIVDEKITHYEQPTLPVSK